MLKSKRDWLETNCIQQEFSVNYENLRTLPNTKYGKVSITFSNQINFAPLKNQREPNLVYVGGVGEAFLTCDRHRVQPPCDRQTGLNADPAKSCPLLNQGMTATGLQPSTQGKHLSHLGRRLSSPIHKLHKVFLCINISINMYISNPYIYMIWSS